jgi:hypothetical protein
MRAGLLLRAVIGQLALAPKSPLVGEPCSYVVTFEFRPLRRAYVTVQFGPALDSVLFAAVAFTAIDGNLRPFRARLISAIHASSVLPPEVDWVK